MKISLEWLSQYLPGPLDANTAADALTNGGLPVENFETAGTDTIIDVEVTSNRGDCLSHIGVARELSALLNRPTTELAPPTLPTSATTTPSAVSVAIEAADLCPHYTARIIRNVKIGPSPQWMARRLLAVGLPVINNVVDITNYVMFEMGQPLHAFDADKVQGNKIIVRRAKPSEKLTSIDGKERTLDATMLVIADANRPVALAGVMGGLDSEISSNTVNVLLESARFDPLSVRKTSRALALKSDSSYRFERQIDPTLPERASLRAAQLILETAGGQLLAGHAEAGSPNDSPRHLTLRLDKLHQVLGVNFPSQEVLEALTRLRFSPKLLDNRIEVTVPSSRLDVNIEVDLVEEVARVLGYHRIPIREEISIRIAPPDPALRTIDTLRTLLVSSGYFEAITVTFVSDNLAADFKPKEAATLPRAEKVTRDSNAHLRPSLLPGLLEAVRFNEKSGNHGAKLFEIGPTFWYDSAGQLDERRRIGLIGSADLHEVRGVVETLLHRLNAQLPVKIIPEDRPGYEPGAAGRIEWNNKNIGHLGLIAKSVLTKLDLRESPATAELELAPLLSAAQHVPQLSPTPKYPAVRRDVSLVVADAVLYAQIESLLSTLKLPDLEQSEYVTTYRGKPLEKGSKSVTLTLVFRSATKTLTSDEVEAAVQKFVVESAKELNATVRA